MTHERNAHDNSNLLDWTDGSDERNDKGVRALAWAAERASINPIRSTEVRPDVTSHFICVAFAVLPSSYS